MTRPCCLFRFEFGCHFYSLFLFVLGKFDGQSVRWAILGEDSLLNMMDNPDGGHYSGKTVCWQLITNMTIALCVIGNLSILSPEATLSKHHECVATHTVTGCGLPNVEDDNTTLSVLHAVHNFLLTITISKTSYK